MTPEERAREKEKAVALARARSAANSSPGINVTPAREPDEAPRSTADVLRETDQVIGELNGVEADSMRAELRANPRPNTYVSTMKGGENPDQPVFRTRSADPMGPRPDTLLSVMEEVEPWLERSAASINGASLTLGDELMGLTIGDNAKEGMRSALADARKKRPGETFALEMAAGGPASAASAIGLTRAGLSPTAVGAIEGAVVGAGESNSETVEGRVLGGTLGAGAGALIGRATGGGINIGRRLRAAASDRPTVSTAARDEFGVALTEGQITQDAGQVGFEQSAANGGRGREAQTVIRPFMDDQAEAVTEAGRGLAGREFDTANSAGAAVAEGLQRRATGAQEAIGDAYDRARSFNASLRADGVASMPSSVREGLPDDVRFALEGIEQGGVEGGLYPGFKSALEAVDRLKTGATRKLGDTTEVTPVEFDRIELVRRAINNSVTAASNPADRRAALAVKKSFDQYIDDAVDAALFEGDAAFLDAYKTARGLRAEFAENFEANKVFERIIAREASPEQTLEYILGANKIAPIERVRTVIPQLKKALGPDSEEWAALQEAAMKRMMRQTEKSYNPKVLRDNLDELLMGRNQTIAQELFTAEQYNALRRYRSVVDRLIPPAGTTNPSGSGYEIGRQLAHEASGMVKIPVVGRWLRAATDKFLPDANAARARKAISPRSVLLDTTLLGQGVPKLPVAPKANADRLKRLGLDVTEKPLPPIRSNGAGSNIAGGLLGLGMMSAGASLPRRDGAPGQAPPSRPVDGQIRTSRARLTKTRLDPYRDTPLAARQDAAESGRNLVTSALISRREQLENMQSGLKAYDPQEELMGGVDSEFIRWQEMARAYQTKVAAGEMTLEEAANALDHHLRRVGVDPRQNPFRSRE